MNLAARWCAATREDPTTVCLRLAALIVVGAAPSFALAQDRPAAEGGIVCEAAGYDVIIRNLGEDETPNGTRIAWSVPFTRKNGEFELTSDLASGDRVFVAAALGSTYVFAGTECVAEVLPPVTP